MSSQAEYQQGELLVIASQSGQMYAPDFYDQAAGESGNPPSISVVEHYIHLQNAITHMAAVSMRDGFTARDDAAIESGQNQAPKVMRKGVENNRGQHAYSAEREFLRATGNEALVGAGLIDEKGLWSLNRQMFSDFMKQYYGARHYQVAQEYRRKLVDHTRILQRGQTEFNRTHGNRPHAAVSKKTTSEQQTPAIKGIDTQERLQAIVIDPRAKFIPTTNREKNQVLSFLDYLDNPDYPFGVNNQFLEVFSHTQKIRRKNKSAESERGPVSITYEFGDYLSNAVTQRKALQELESLLVTLPNLRVTLGEEQEWIDVSHPGFAALVRYRDLTTFMQKGSLEDVKDPLRTQEDRWERTGSGRHKLVEDRYTAGEKKKNFENYIAHSTFTMTVGEARQLIGPAITDQLMREAFMQERLEEIATPPVVMRGKAREVLRAASNAAQEVLEELIAA